MGPVHDEPNQLPPGGAVVNQRVMPPGSVLGGRPPQKFLLPRDDYGIRRTKLANFVKKFQFSDRADADLGVSDAGCWN